MSNGVSPFYQLLIPPWMEKKSWCTKDRNQPTSCSLFSNDDKVHPKRKENREEDKVLWTCCCLRSCNDGLRCKRHYTTKKELEYAKTKKREIQLRRLCTYFVCTVQGCTLQDADAIPYWRCSRTSCIGIIDISIGNVNSCVCVCVYSWIYIYIVSSDYCK